MDTLPRQKRLTVPTARKKDPTTGEWGPDTPINVDPHAYTSVHDWKPIPFDKFVWLLHAYGMQPEATDEFGHSAMHTTMRHLSRGVTSIIHYIPKEAGSAVSSPVLMTLSYESGKVICFASLSYGREVDQTPANG